MGIKRVVVLGYRHTELGIFSDKDLRLAIIKQAIKEDLRSLLDDGVEWFVFTGNLGFEYWTLEVLEELKEEGYTYQRATVFAFETHGENWQEASQVKLARFRQADYVQYAYPSYENPSQFRLYNQFLLDHTDAAYIFYDTEHETSLKYMVDLMKERKAYPIYSLSFDRLNEIAENFSDFE